MRTTLTIDDDVAALLKKEMGRSGQPFKQTLNRILRAGFASHAAPKKLARFKVRARPVGISEAWMDGSTQNLMDRLDGPLSR